jgi:hypothetical protein
VIEKLNSKNFKSDWEKLDLLKNDEIAQIHNADSCLKLTLYGKILCKNVSKLHKFYKKNSFIILFLMISKLWQKRSVYEAAEIILHIKFF